jgi:DNA-directed RNA polymerase alpha subunit
MCRLRLPDDPNPEVPAMEGKGNIQAGDLLDPTPELPDDTPLDRVQFPTRVQAALAASGLRTVGEIRESSKEMLLDLKDLGSGSVWTAIV